MSSFPARASTRAASAGERSSSVSAVASANPDNGLRLVMSAAQVGLPGRSGRTCASFRALSRTTSARPPARRLRKARAAASGVEGISPLCHVQGAKELLQDHHRVQPLALLATKIGEQLCVGEPIANLVREMDGQRRLADPWWPVDGDNRSVGRSSDRGDEPAARPARQCDR